MNNPYPLSSMQKGMLFHAISAPQSGVDIQQIMIGLQDSFDQDLFVQAWQQVAQRHAILRMSYQWEDVDTPVQFVHEHIEIPLHRHDWRALPAADQAKKLLLFKQEDRLTDFQLDQPPAFRLNLFQMGEADYRCLWTFHHILLDGRSFPIILRELFTIYDALRQGETVEIPEPRPYGDYLQWIDQKEFAPSEPFWRSFLSQFTAPTPLTVSKTTQLSHVSRALADEELRIPAVTVGQLDQYAKANGVTMNTLIQGAWGLVWHHYTNEETVLFGTTRACRYGLEGLADMVGVFINTLPMRSDVSHDMTLGDYMRDIRQKQIALRDHEHTPLAEVQKWSDVPRGSNLFDTLVVFENYDLNEALRAQGGEWLKRTFKYKGQTNFPLTLMAYNDGDLALRLEYDADIFEVDQILRMLHHLETIFTALPTADPQLPALTHPYLAPTERQTILNRWNPPYDFSDPPATTQIMIATRAAQSPQATAVRFLDQTLTYKELEQQSNRLAHYLSQKGAGPNTFVGLCLPRGLEMIVTMLAILKAGSAYVPLDPKFPRDRLAHMIEDSQMPVLVTNHALRSFLPEHSTHEIELDTQAALLATGPTHPLSHEAHPDDLAYVIYTSGSTGKPKGVKVPHGALSNFLLSMQKEPGFTADDTLVAITTISFDIAMLEMFLPLISGGTLVIAADDVTSDGIALAELIAESRATIMQATPATWHMLLDSGWQGEKRLKILCGGEPLPRRLADKLLERSGQLWNMYGPTETTIWSSVARVAADGQSIDIGRPIRNTTMYILDPYNQPVPAGIIGELCIGGGGVTQGYLNRDELTEEKFLPNPFIEGDMIYRTGDWARHNRDGTIECLGRIDHQVKIRGFRIELGEIEAVMSQHDGVQEVVVVAHETAAGSKQLVGYVTTKPNRLITVSELRKFGKTKLPDYMVPATFIMLDVFPLTDNNKINRRLLPSPDGERPELDNVYVAPRGEMENRLAKIWQDVLVVSQVGAHDSFFDLGGDSLLVVRMLNKVRETTGIRIPVHQIFAHRTVRALADYLIQMSTAEPAPKAAVSDRNEARAAKRREALAKKRKTQARKSRPRRP